MLSSPLAGFFDFYNWPEQIQVSTLWLVSVSQSCSPPVALRSVQNSFLKSPPALLVQVSIYRSTSTDGACRCTWVFIGHLCAGSKWITPGFPSGPVASIMSQTVLQQQHIIKGFRQGSKHVRRVSFCSSLNIKKMICRAQEPVWRTEHSCFIPAEARCDSDASGRSIWLRRNLCHTSC